MIPRARRDRLDAPGIAALTAVSALLAFNQIVVVWVNEGLQPVFFAGLRSALAVVFVLAWLRLRGHRLQILPGTVRPGLAMGLAFAAEFLCLFLALDLTTVPRAAILFYSMPVWFGLMAHWGLPGERLTPLRGLGLLLAFAGTVVAILDRTGHGAGRASLAGDLLALGGAVGWALTAFLARASRLRLAGAEMQLLWMVAVSGPALILVAPLFGPLVRDLAPSHIGWLLFQAGIVVTGGFVAWLSLLAVYPAAAVGSFAFLTPVISLFLGWAILGEPVGPGLLVALALVAAGIVLVNRRA